MYKVTIGIAYNSNLLVLLFDLKVKNITKILYSRNLRACQTLQSTNGQQSLRVFFFSSFVFAKTIKKFRTLFSQIKLLKIIIYIYIIYLKLLLKFDILCPLYLYIFILYVHISQLCSIFGFYYSIALLLPSWYGNWTTCNQLFLSATLI